MKQWNSQLSLNLQEVVQIIWLARGGEARNVAFFAQPQIYPQKLAISKKSTILWILDWKSTDQLGILRKSGSQNLKKISQF